MIIAQTVGLSTHVSVKITKKCTFGSTMHSLKLSGMLYRSVFFYAMFFQHASRIQALITVLFLDNTCNDVLNIILCCCLHACHYISLYVCYVHVHICHIIINDLHGVLFWFVFYVILSSLCLCKRRLSINRFFGRTEVVDFIHLMKSYDCKK